MAPTGRTTACGRSEPAREVSDDGIGPLREAAQQPGCEPLLAEMEKLVTDAELAGSRGPRNQALVEWRGGGGGGRPLSGPSLNSRRAVCEALETHDLATRVAHVVGRDDVRRTKPAPEGLLLVAERHGVDPGRILFIGDKDGDRECAEQAGAAFLHVEEIGV